MATLLFAIGIVIVLASPPGLIGPLARFARCALFYAMTIATFLAAPKRRRVDLSLALTVTFGCLEAVAYCATVRDRAFDGLLPAGDLAAIAAATIPAATERLRYAARRRGWTPLDISQQL
jgi:hypothetical protein